MIAASSAGRLVDEGLDGGVSRIVTAVIVDARTRPSLGVRLHGGDPLDDLNPFDDPREHRVLTIEGRLIGDGDEEL